MQTKEAITKVVFVSKKKNFDNIEDPDCKDAIKEINENKEAITYIALEGNSYSKEFCEQFGGLLKDCNAITVSLLLELINSSSI